LECAALSALSSRVPGLPLPGLPLPGFAAEARPAKRDRKMPSCAMVKDAQLKPVMNMKIKLAVAAIVGLLTILNLFALPTARGADGQESKAPTQGPSVWDGVYNKEQAERGRKLYRGQCASCHGETLSGGESAPPLAGGEFLSSWNGLTVGDLFERIRVTMPQDDPGTLSRQENADIISYILSVNKFPSGKTELQQKTEQLKQIRIEATRPDPKK
jgi:quinoprotein glucose dehydrogenase